MEMRLESPRRSSSSPEFEFWMVGNAHPDLHPHLLTADELFVDGVLLPLHLLSVAPESTPPGLDSETILKSEPDADAEKRSKPSSSSREQEEAVVVVALAAAAAPIPTEASFCSSTAPSISSSKRWKDIFKVGGGEKKKESREEKDKKKERKSSNGAGGGTGGGAAELNINIWPFSRSRSAGTASGVRPKAAAAAAAMRKSSSAPCSRSNSRGENAGGRRWAASPGRPGVGVPVGRASPVWQARRGAGAGRAGPIGEKGRKRVDMNGGGVRGLNLNVNSCIGYRDQASCRGAKCDARERVGVDNNTNNNGGLFRFRALFSKKVY